MARTAARDAALRLLYETEMGGDGGLDGLADMLDLRFSAQDRAYIEEITQGVSQALAALDEAIGRCAKDWTTERMARVDLCILRLAVYEMQHREDIPQSVSINEAVQLAHDYSGEEAASFINGVLGTIARTENAT